MVAASRQEDWSSRLHYRLGSILGDSCRLRRSYFEHLVPSEVFLPFLVVEGPFTGPGNHWWSSTIGHVSSTYVSSPNYHAT